MIDLIIPRVGGVVKWGSGGKLGKIAGEGQLGRAGEIDVLAVQIDAEHAAVRLHLRAAAADKAEPGQRRDGRARFSPVTAQRLTLAPRGKAGLLRRRAASSRSSARGRSSSVSTTACGMPGSPSSR